MADAEVLKAAGLQGWHAAGAAVAVWSTVAAGVFGFVAAMATGGNYLIEQHAMRVALQQDGLANPLWLRTSRELTNLGFDRDPLGDGLVLFHREPEADENAPLVEAVIRRNNLTVAVMEIIALDDDNSWEWASADLMTDGSTVEEAVANSDIPRWLAQRSDNEIDIIGIGVASLARGQPIVPSQTQSGQSDLASRRAVRLATQFRETAGFIASRPVRYWALELGSAKTERPRDSREERRQRAAIVVALSRRMTVEGGPISPEAALALITTNVSVYGTDLTDYQFSAAPRIHQLR